MKRIINSVLDTDTYKITMGQGYFNKYDRLKGEFGLTDRGNIVFPKGFANALRDQVGMMADLKLTEEEEKYLRSDTFYYLKPGYIDWFSHYRFNPKEVVIDQFEGELQVFVNGHLYRITYWEVPLLATIAELYYNTIGVIPDSLWQERTVIKATRWKENDVHFADFGTRRRFSQAVQEEVIKILREYAGSIREGGVLNGTSNIDLARRYNLIPIGTYAHEWVMTHAALYGITMANEKAMEAWADEFGAYLGIALSDTYTTNKFLESFSAYYAKLFDGTRQDSGDPFIYADKLVNHYKQIRVNPLYKTIVFSNDLDLEMPIRIARYCKGNILSSFGIGQYITNDVGAEKMKLVMKLWSVTLPNGIERNVVKIPDDQGKIIGNPEAIKLALGEINQPQ